MSEGRGGPGVDATSKRLARVWEVRLAAGVGGGVQTPRAPRTTARSRHLIVRAWEATEGGWDT